MAPGRSTGGSRSSRAGPAGIGEAAVRALHAAGAHVVIADVTDAPGGALAADLGDRARA